MLCFYNKNKSSYLDQALKDAVNIFINKRISIMIVFTWIQDDFEFKMAPY